jgi:hypothetical protein
MENRNHRAGRDAYTSQPSRPRNHPIHHPKEKNHPASCLCPHPQKINKTHQPTGTAVTIILCQNDMARDTATWKIPDKLEERYIGVVQSTRS